MKEKFQMVHEGITNSEFVEDLLYRERAGSSHMLSKQNQQIGFWDKIDRKEFATIIWICCLIALYLICINLRKSQFTCPCHADDLSLASVAEIAAP